MNSRSRIWRLRNAFENYCFFFLCCKPVWPSSFLPVLVHVNICPRVPPNLLESLGLEVPGQGKRKGRHPPKRRRALDRSHAPATRLSRERADVEFPRLLFKVISIASSLFFCTSLASVDWRPPFFFYDQCWCFWLFAIVVPLSLGASIAFLSPVFSAFGGLLCFFSFPLLFFFCFILCGKRLWLIIG